MLKDNVKYGIFLGILGPIVAVLIFYFWKFGSAYTFKDFWAQLMLSKNKLLVGVLSFSLIANAITFTLFINTDKDGTAKGIFIVTMLWAVIILLLKFL